MNGYGSRREVNSGRLWSGGLATAVVAGLVIVVGALVSRGVLDIPVLAPREAGNFGDATTGASAAMAAICALVATGLLHLLVLTAPRPLSFFGWIVGLATVVAAVSPFTLDAGWQSQLATAVINAVTGIAILSLLTSVAATSVRHSRRFDDDYPGGYAGGYRDAVTDDWSRRQPGRRRNDDRYTDPDAETRIEGY